ncbi:MAG: c-type cytochrome [Magnetovibrio sp.]|nr:c-type cytochrome [Magnetovibrio sp.]
MIKTKIFAIGFAVALAAGMTAGSADAADGEKVWNKCKACHTLTAQNRVGPGLAGSVGRKCGSAKGYKYGKGYQKACDKGFTLDEAFLMDYLKDPSKKLSAVAGKKVRSKMAFKLKKEDQRKAVIAFLKSK